MTAGASPSAEPIDSDGGRFDVAIQDDQIELELTDGDDVLPVLQRGLDPSPRLRKVRGRLPDRRADGRRGVEEQGSAQDEGRCVDDADGDTAPDAGLLGQPRDDGRQHEGEEPGREEDQEDLREAAQHLEQEPDQKQRQVDGRDDEQDRQPPSVAPPSRRDLAGLLHLLALCHRLPVPCTWPTSSIRSRGIGARRANFSLGQAPRGSGAPRGCRTPRHPGSRRGTASNARRRSGSGPRG